jgi:hypothetical protein
MLVEAHVASLHPQQYHKKSLAPKLQTCEKEQNKNTAEQMLSTDEVENIDHTSISSKLLYTRYYMLSIGVLFQGVQMCLDPCKDHLSLLIITSF